MATDDDDPVLPAVEAVAAAELLRWQRKYESAPSAFHPVYGVSPNPVIVGDLVVASLFAARRIVAVERHTGEERWSIPLPYYGSSHLRQANGVLYGGTSQALLAIEAESGRILWKFSPYGEKGESLYAAPAIAGNRIFLGDRMGYFHCLDRATGQPLWSVLTSRAWNNDVNATAAVLGDRVITATNARLVLAYDTTSGKELWRRRISNSSIWEVLPYREWVLVQTNSVLYAIDPETGEVRQRWCWPGRVMWGVSPAGDVIPVLHMPAWMDVKEFERMKSGTLSPRAQKAAKRKYRAQRKEPTRLRGIRPGETLWEIEYPRSSRAATRYAPEPGWLLETTAAGLGFLDPLTGRRRAVIHTFSRDEHDAVHYSGLPTAADGCLYILSEDGMLCALRLPECVQHRPEPINANSQTAPGG